jgi:hypothetical protein
MRNSLIKSGVIVTLAGALALSSATPSLARDWGRTAAAAGIGFAAGTILGSAVASQHRYYGPYAYDPYPYGGPAYAYEPAYSYDPGPAYAYEPGPVYSYEPAPTLSFGRCWISTDNSRPFGYWGACPPGQTPAARAQAGGTR